MPEKPINVCYIGHETPWRTRVVDIVSNQFQHINGASVATWEPVPFAGLEVDNVWTADDLCVMFSIQLPDPSDQAQYEQASKAYNPKTCQCSACLHYRALVKQVGKERMPAPGVGCLKVPVKPVGHWWRVYVRENLVGVIHQRKWDRNRGEYVSQWFKFTGCKHEYSHRTPYRCYHEYACPKCGHQYAVDSSD